ncbi:TIGR03747 family integrating conjugative element membrane protein [Vibrio fluvialis]|nr:TIGR03747 family integrating conjugative element membrane protein [Vibrio fluvialis]
MIMGSPSKNKAAQQQASNKNTDKVSLTKMVFDWLVALPVVILLTIVLSVLVEWVGLNFIWKDEGVNHSKMMLMAEVGYLNSYFKDSVLISSPALLAKKTTVTVNRAVFQPLGVEKTLNSRNEYGFIQKHLVSAYFICQVVVIRLCVLLFSFPVYVLFGLVGIVTGLVERDLRRFGAGRELDDRYELAKRFIKPSVVLCFMLYLSWPDSVNPAFVIVPFAGMFGFAIHFTFKHYKKYF